MANKNKKNPAAEAARKQQAPTDKKPTVNVIDMGNFNADQVQKGFGQLDANHTVELLKMQHETFRMDPNAAEKYGMSKEAVDSINQCNAIGQVAIMAVQMTQDKSAFACIMKSAALPQFLEAAKSLNINIDVKALPAPDAEGNLNIPSTAVSMNKETQKKVKEEIDASKKDVKKDVSKIENDGELKDTILNFLSINSPGGFYQKIYDAVTFYQSYRTLELSKKGDKNGAEAIKNKTFADVMVDMVSFIGKCPFTLTGLSSFMFEKTMEAKNPVAAFCSFRDASLNKTTGMPTIEDSIVADIVKVFIKWCADSKIEEAKASIEACKKNLEILKKDPKKNEKAIKSNEGEITRIEGKIAEFGEVANYAMNPSADTVKVFVNDYNDNKAEGFKNARMTASKILNSYYPGIKMKDVEQDNLILVLEQYFGVILNLFLPDMDKIAEYSVENIPELKKIGAEDSSKKE